jgi:hypothetical protein
MGLSVSILLAAAGAILIWAVDASVSGVNLDAVGVILLVVGIVGALLSFAFWSSWGGFNRADGTTVNSTTIVEDGVNRR